MTDLDLQEEVIVRRNARVQKICAVLFGIISAMLGLALFIQSNIEDSSVGFFQFMPKISILGTLTNYAVLLIFGAAIIVPGLLWEGANRRIEHHRERRKIAESERTIKALLNQR